MERHKEDSLAEHADAFDRSFSGGKILRERFARAGLTLSAVREVPKRRSWLFYFQPTPRLRRRFDLAPEVLAVVVPFAQAQAAEIDAARAALRETHRLDRGLVLFLSRDPAAERELAAVLPAEIAFAFVEIGAFLEAPDPEATVRELLSQTFGSGRPFAPGSPVSDAQFFGRQDELLGLERRLLETASLVGLFGLRKIGKTSLIHRLRQKWRDDRGASGPRALLVYCDLQSIPFTRRSRVGLMRRLVEVVRDEVECCDLAAAFTGQPWLTSDLRTASDQVVEGLAVEALEDLISWTKRAESNRLVLAIDEYERLLSGEAFTRRDGLDFLDLLRGLAQQYPRSFSFIVAGLNRRWILEGRYEARQNPLFGALYQMPLAGLSRQELGTLLRKLGRRAGLDFGHEAIDQIYRESGGHPYLARLLADLLDQRAARDRGEPLPLSAADVESSLAAFDREAATTMREIADTVGDLAHTSEKTDPELVLTWLRHPDAPAPAVLRDDLIRYGLVDAATSRMRIGAFARWARENYTSVRAAYG